MITIDSYFDKIDEIVAELLEHPMDVHRYVEHALNDEPIIRELIDFRESLLTEDDTHLVSGYLTTGALTGLASRTREAGIMFVFEIERNRELKRIMQECDKYDISDPLFIEVPQLFELQRGRKKPGGELLPRALLIRQANTPNGTTFGRNVQLSPMLDSYLLDWTDTNFPDAVYFVRLNPDRVSHNSIPFLITGTPRRDYQVWRLYNAIPDFTIEDLLHTTGAYILEKGSLATNEEVYDHGTHLRIVSAVISFDRKKSYLSGMIEEIDESKRECGYVLGRMVHFDMECSDLSSNSDILLKHLDLALNVYVGNTAEIRLDEARERRSRIVDATRRIHLFRVDNVPAKSLQLYTYILFRGFGAFNRFFTKLHSRN